MASFVMRPLVMRPFALLGLGITLMCLSNPTLSKDFYKWQDAEGVTHYSSQPSKEYKSVKVRASNIKDSATTDSDSPAETGNNANNSDSTAAEPAAANTPASAEHTKDPERCAVARQNRKTMEENSRIRMKDGDEYRYLTPEEIQQQKDTTDEIIAQEC